MAELSAGRRRGVSLDDIADGELDELRGQGFDWIYLLGVWQTGTLGREISRGNAEWRGEHAATLPDLRDEDICGSCFAVTGYSVHESLGGDEALRRLAERIHARGMKLMLDFVPNHMAPDHPWAQQHPDFFVGGTEDDLVREPHNYTSVETARGRRVFAYGRDPYFAGWPDTLQLNYGNAALQEAMQGELMKAASLCDGLRCDMAMLILPEVFERTWGIEAQPFWPEAIRRVRERQPDFVFMAEVYWDMEWALQQLGFDYTYDKRLYDRLREQNAHPVREHFRADADYQNRSVRFLENHDEPRAAATFPHGVHQAAALLTFLCPGLRFFHHGQMHGWEKKISIHLCRGPEQPTSPTIAEFYRQLLGFLRNPVVREGQWQMLQCVAVADDNPSYQGMIGFAWQREGDARALIVVNYAPRQGQCYVRLPFADLRGRPWRLTGCIGSENYERDGDRLAAEGLFVDLPPWGYHVFEVEPL